MVYSVESLEVRLIIKLIYAIKVALSFLVVIYLVQHNTNLILKYKSKQKVDRLTLMAQLLFLCEQILKLARDAIFYNLLHNKEPDNRLFINLYASVLSKFFQTTCYLTLQVLWVDIILMVKALEGDHVIEVKKKNFNHFERRLLLLFGVITACIFVSTIAKGVYLNFHCSEDPKI